MNKRAFSFVEIIISISILVVLAIVATTATNNIKNNSNNSKVIADLATLQNGFISMESEGNNLPEPDGNKNYYTSDGSYAHDKGEAYGVYGKVTQDTLDNRYLNITPLDPRTNQYYSYGVALDSNQFEVAGVIFNEEGHRAKVQGNYSAENGIYNLIRDHNSNNFVMDKGPYLPYNPEEKLLTAKDDQGYIYYEGDEVTNNTGGDMEIYFSDGSSSIISPSTSLVLTQMDFPKENNLVSKVKIFLDAGSIWTQATSLNEESSFDIFTTDTTASVRGTIFGVDTDGTNTQVTVEKGEVEVKKIPRNITKEEIIEKPDVISEEIERAIYDDSITPEIIEVNTSISSGKVLKYDGNTTQELDISVVEKPEMNRIFSSITFEEKSIVSADDNVATIDTTVEEVGQSCYLGEVEILDGKSREDAYSERISINCSDYKSPEPRYCNDGILEGDNKYKYSECRGPNTCSISYDNDLVHSGTTYDFTVGLSSLNIGKGEITNGITSQGVDIANGIKKLEIDLECDSNLNYIPTRQSEQVFCNEGFSPGMLPGETTMSCISECDGLNIGGECVENNTGSDDEDWEIYGHMSYNNNSTQNDLYKLYLNGSSKNAKYNNDAMGHNGTESSFINDGWAKGIWNNYTINNKTALYFDDIGNQSCNIVGYCSPNPSGQDSLLYENIINDDSYSIEISVRGKELKRNDTRKRYLFDTGSNGVGLYQKNGELYLIDKTKSTFEIHNVINIFGNNKISINNIDNNSFYKILLYVDEKDFRLHVMENDGDIIWQIFNDGTANEPHDYKLLEDESINHIYIGSDSNKINQWNGLIEYVTIYEED